MIESQLKDPLGTKAVGFSHGDFGFVVQALHHAAGNQLLSPEVVEDQFAMLTERTGNLLHRLDARAHGLTAPILRCSCDPD